MNKNYTKAWRGSTVTVAVTVMTVNKNVHPVGFAFPHHLNEVSISSYIQIVNKDSNRRLKYGVESLKPFFRSRRLISLDHFINKKSPWEYFTDDERDMLEFLIYLDIKIF